MITSQILKFVNSPEKEFKYLENKTFFLQIKKIIHSGLSYDRSSRSQMFFKIDVFKNFAIFTGKQLCSSLFLVKLKSFSPATLLKKDTNIYFSIFLLSLNMLLGNGKSYQIRLINNFFMI